MGEVGRMIVAKKISFDAAHFLPFHEGKCKSLHGHRWVVEIGVGGEVKEDTGMVIDFSILKAFLSLVEDTFDHKLLNDIIFNPTAENIIKWIQTSYIVYKSSRIDLFKGIELKWIKVWETEDSYALLSY